MTTNPEIKFFINARPRTGGTLLATMLNSHPYISMGYEIYPQLLENPEGSGFRIDELIAMLRESADTDSKNWIRAMPKDSFRTFTARAQRSGLSPSVLLEELTNLSGRFDSFEKLEQKLEFIENLLFRQARLTAKPIVGAKMRAELSVLHTRHPSAVFLMMVRDGRDMFASIKSRGQFNVTADQSALDWASSLTEFEDFISASDVKGKLVKYESLVSNPEQELSSILELAGIEFNQDMINYEKQPQELFSNSFGHLSAQQLAKGLNSSSIGRWTRGDLSEQEIADFTSRAESTLTKYGYL